MQLVTTHAELEKAVEYFTHDAQYLCFDVETIGDHRIDTWRNVVAWIAVGDPQETFVIPCGHPNGELLEERYPLKENDDLRARLARGLQPRKSDYSVDSKKSILVFAEPPEHLDRTTVFGALKPLFLNDSLLKVGHNLGFDLGSVAKYLGDIPAPPYADTMTLARLLDPDMPRGFNLQSLVKKYADFDIEKGVGEDISRHSFDEVARYSGLDVVATVKLWEAMRPRIDEDGLQKVFELEMQVLPVVTRMRLQGITIDVDSLEPVRVKLASAMQATRAAIYDLAGREFNLNANREKQRILYSPKTEGGRGLAKKVLTNSGMDKQQRGEELGIEDYSVAAKALELYRDSDELVGKMLEHSDLNKLLSVYIAPYLDKSRGLVDDGVIRTEFLQHGTATGRFSSKNPNLQNIPGPRTEYGKLIRNLFVAPKGHRLVVADYSQIEPRIVAMLSKDPTMVQAYRDGEDIYAAVGERMGVSRAAGKVLVLSITYGAGPAKISGQIGCSITEARELLDHFDEQFSSIARFKTRSIIKAKNRRPVPYVVTFTGRRRYLPNLKSDDFQLRSAAERRTFNSIVQGSAADVMKMSMIFVDSLLPESSFISLTVHDEIVVVTPEEQLEESVAAVRSGMEDQFKSWMVPLPSNITVVERWGDAK